VSCSDLQCVAVICSELQCVAASSLSVEESKARITRFECLCRSELQRRAVSCSELQ